MTQPRRAGRLAERLSADVAEAGAAVLHAIGALDEHADREHDAGRRRALKRLAKRIRKAVDSHQIAELRAWQHAIALHLLREVVPDPGPIRSESPDLGAGELDVDGGGDDWS